MTPNVANDFNTMNKGLFAGLSAAGILESENVYPDFGACAPSSLAPETADASNQASR